MPYTDVEGAKLYWEESGTGTPLLMIQGLGWSGAMWHRMVPEFEPHYRVIRYDARGVGRSDVPPGPYPIARMAADAMAILDAAEAGDAHVIACSLGGIVAQEAALTWPERFRSVSLLCTHPAGEEAVWPDTAAMEMLTKRATMPLEEAIEAALPWTYAPDTPRALIDQDIALRLEIRTTGEGYTNQLTGGLGYPGTAARLPALRVPTLVMTGDADKLVPPANSDILAERIPGARKVVIPGGSHVFFTERPAEASAPILRFLADVDQEVSRVRS